MRLTTYLQSFTLPDMINVPYALPMSKEGFLTCVLSVAETNFNNNIFTDFMNKTKYYCGFCGCLLLESVVHILLNATRKEEDYRNKEAYHVI